MWALLLAALAYAALGLVPAPATIAASFSRELSAWSRLGFIRAAVGLGGSLVALGVWRAIRNGSHPAPLHCLVLVGATLCAAANAVLIAKYLAGSIPNTAVADVIELYAAHDGGLIDLYQAQNAVAPPLLTPIYGPGYFAALQTLRALLGGNAGLAARLLSTLAILAFTIGVYLVARRVLPRPAAGVAPLLLLATFPTLVWSGPPTKPEYLACALAILGLSVCLGDESARPSARLVLGGALFGAALLVKFTIVGMFGAVVLHHAVMRRWRALAVLAVVSGMPLVFVYGMLWGPTHGGVWLFTVEGAGARPDLERAFGAIFERTLPLALPALVLAAAALSSWSSGPRTPQGVVGCAAILSFAGFMASSTRPGSSANYLLEFAVVAAVVLAGIVSDESGDPVPSRANGVVLALIALVLAADLPRRYALLAQSESRYGSDRAVARRVLSEIETQPGDLVLTAPDYTRETIEAGHTPLVYDGLQFTLMQDNGRVSDAPILEALRTGRVRHALLADDLDTEQGKEYGRRDFSLETLRFLRDHFDCRSIAIEPVSGAPVHCKRR